jgi:hypothetical protein
VAKEKPAESSTKPKEQEKKRYVKSEVSEVKKSFSRSADHEKRNYGKIENHEKKIPSGPPAEYVVHEPKNQPEVSYKKSDYVKKDYPQPKVSETKNQPEASYKKSGSGGKKDHNKQPKPKSEAAAGNKFKPPKLNPSAQEFTPSIVYSTAIHNPQPHSVHNVVDHGFGNQQVPQISHAQIPEQPVPIPSYQDLSVYSNVAAAYNYSMQPTPIDYTQAQTHLVYDPNTNTYFDPRLVYIAEAPAPQTMFYQIENHPSVEEYSYAPQQEETERHSDNSANNHKVS